MPDWTRSKIVSYDVELSERTPTGRLAAMTLQLENGAAAWLYFFPPGNSALSSLPAFVKSWPWDPATGKVDITANLPYSRFHELWELLREEGPVSIWLHEGGRFAEFLSGANPTWRRFTDTGGPYFFTGTPTRRDHEPVGEDEGD
jgi:hypothetical protein